MGVEGAHGPFNVKEYRDQKSLPGYDLAAQLLLKTNLIAGPEYLAFTANEEPALWGVETTADYVENVEAYRAARGDAVAAGGALGADTQSDGFTLYLGEDWARTSAGEGVYCLTLRETGKHAAAVLVSGAEGERIFSLNVKAVAYG